MSLFDNFSSVRQSTNLSTFSPAEAFCGIIVAAITSDGHASEAEIQMALAILSRTNMFRSYPSEVVTRIFKSLGQILDRHGLETLIQLSVSSLPYELNETAFAIATDLVLSDGEVTESEEALLNYLCSQLGVAQSTAHKIIEVMLIKNRG